MTHPLTNTRNTTREYNIFIAEAQAHIIDALIFKFTTMALLWFIDCGYHEITVISLWDRLGYTEKHLYQPELIELAKEIAWRRL